MKILIVGCGSIGRRHLANLNRLGYRDLIAFRSHRDHAEELAAAYGVRSVFSLQDAMAQQPEVAIIANPTSLHLPVAQEVLRAGCHLLIEKPLSHSLSGVDELLKEASERQRVVCVAYQWRFHPLLLHLKAQIDAGRIGRVISMRAQVGQYLPDWHPWEDYRRGYYGRADLGGGAVLTLSHELDYVLWFLGAPSAVTCFTAHTGRLDIDTEDVAEILLHFPNGSLASVHVDYFQRTVTRSCQIVGEAGLVEVDLMRGVARTFQAGRGRWEEDLVPEGFTWDDLYVAELEHFFDCVRRGSPCRVDGHAGRLTLQAALAAKESAETGHVVTLDEPAAVRQG